METVSEIEKMMKARVVKDYLRAVRLGSTAELLKVGFTIKEIGKILGIPESSVRILALEAGHVTEAKEGLG